MKIKRILQITKTCDFIKIYEEIYMYSDTNICASHISNTTYCDRIEKKTGDLFIASANGMFVRIYFLNEYNQIDSEIELN